MTIACTPASNRPSAPAGSVTVRDLFTLDSPLHGEIRGERSLMAFPFFALSKNAWMKPLTYDHATVSIEVRPSASGVATIYDKEIVLYIASLMAAKLEAGESVEQDFVLTAHDLFSVTGSNHSARSYGRLSEALERLQGTQIKTNIEAGGEGGGLLLVAVRGEAPLQQDAHRRTVAEGGQGTPVRLAGPCDPARPPCPRLCRGLFPAGADRAAHLRGRALDLRGRAARHRSRDLPPADRLSEPAVELQGGAEADRRDQRHSRFPPRTGRGDRGRACRGCRPAPRPSRTPGPRHHHPAPAVVGGGRITRTRHGDRFAVILSGRANCYLKARMERPFLLESTNYSRFRCWIIAAK
jgi:hypothetical protein